MHGPLGLQWKHDILILMSTIERITITLTAEMAQAVRTAVHGVDPERKRL